MAATYITKKKKLMGKSQKLNTALTQILSLAKLMKFVQNLLKTTA